MKNLNLLISVCFLSILLPPFVTQATHKQVNGCGDDSGLGRFVPNQPSGVDFRPVCDDHDRCYGILGKSRQDCDNSFRSGLRARCEKELLRSTGGILGTVLTGGQALTYCYSVAEIYYQAVRERGGTAYSTAQNHAKEERDSQNSNSRGVRFIKNTLSGKCIDVSGAPGTANGSQLLLWDCETSGFNRDNGSPTDQKWTLSGDGFIRNTLSDKCIDVSGAPGTANGSQLLLWDCETSGFNRDNGSPTDQKWTLSGDGFIRNTLSGKCIDVSGAPGTANGSQLLLWDCETSGFNRDNGSPTDQKWTLSGDGDN